MRACMHAALELPARVEKQKDPNKSQLTNISLELLRSIFIPGPGGWVGTFPEQRTEGEHRGCGSRCDGSVVESGESGGRRGLLKQGEGTET